MDYSLLHMERESGDEVWDNDGRFIASFARKEEAAIVASIVNSKWVEESQL